MNIFYIIALIALVVAGLAALTGSLPFWPALIVAAFAAVIGAVRDGRF